MERWFQVSSLAVEESKTCGAYFMHVMMSCMMLSHPHPHPYHNCKSVDMHINLWNCGEELSTTTIWRKPNRISAVKSVDILPLPRNL
jgi:hypothetical protein